MVPVKQPESSRGRGKVGAPRGQGGDEGNSGRGRFDASPAFVRQESCDARDPNGWMALRPDFVIADTHFFHQNIVQYQDRPFDHDWIMLKRWRSVVRDSHTVLHLGDLFFGKKKGLERFTYEIAPRLTGRKFIILGNHDNRAMDYEAFGFTVLRPYQIPYRDYVVSFDHYPKLLHANERRIHLHGHIHGNGYAQGEPTRPHNVNVSVEVIDYRPQRFTSLVNHAIVARKHGGRFYNSQSYRQATTARQRRAAA